MNDYKVKVNDKKGSIVFENFEEIKGALAEQMAVYSALEITEDGNQEAKKDVATLRKIKKAIDDRRKEIKNGFMDPYTDFEKQVKELTALIDAPITMISAKLDTFEQKRIEEKRAHIRDLWNENIKVPNANMSVFYDPSWENSTTTDASIKSDISALNVKYESGLQVINSFDDVGAWEIQKAIDIFVKSKLDSTSAIMEINHFREAKKMIEEQARKEAERKAEMKRIERETEKKAKINQEQPEQLLANEEADSFSDIPEAVYDERTGKMIDLDNIPDGISFPDLKSKSVFEVTATEEEYNNLVNYLYSNNIAFSVKGV